MSAAPSGSAPAAASVAMSRAVGTLPGGALGVALDDVLTELGAGRAGADMPSVLDCGGGSGSLAVPIAARGAMVTVVDSSIDALAILGRRAGEAGVAGRVRAVQADVENLAELVANASVDLVLLHGVVTSAADGTQVFAAAAAAVRPGGYLSVVVANPAAGVLSRALSGDLDAALGELSADGPALDLPWLTHLAEAEGMTVVVAQGLAAFSSTVPGSVVSAAHRADDVLAALDRLAATRSPYRDIAGQLHLVARRPGDAAR